MSASGALYIFLIFDGALIGEGRLLERDAYFEILKIDIQIFHMHFKIKYHPSMFEKYRIFHIDEHI